MDALVFDAALREVRESTLEEEILNIIKKSHGPIDLDVIVDKLVKGYSEYDIKDAVWTLISWRKVKLTPERKLTAS